jgi:hypothetical protein
LKCVMDAPCASLVYIELTVYDPEGSSAREILSAHVVRMVLSMSVCSSCHDRKSSKSRVRLKRIEPCYEQAWAIESIWFSQILKRKGNWTLRGSSLDHLSNQKRVLWPSLTSCFAPSSKKCLILFKFSQNCDPPWPIAHFSEAAGYLARIR